MKTWWRIILENVYDDKWFYELQYMDLDEDNKDCAAEQMWAERERIA